MKTRSSTMLHQHLLHLSMHPSPIHHKWWTFWTNTCAATNPLLGEAYSLQLQQYSNKHAKTSFQAATPFFQFSTNSSKVQTKKLPRKQINSFASLWKSNLLVASSQIINKIFIISIVKTINIDFFNTIIQLLSCLKVVFTTYWLLLCCASFFFFFFFDIHKISLNRGDRKYFCWADFLYIWNIDSMQWGQEVSHFVSDSVW